MPNCHMPKNALAQLLVMVQVFNEKHASSHLGIPLGAVISPALPHCQPERAQHEPICCSNCDAFVNLYNEVQSHVTSIHPSLCPGIFQPIAVKRKCQL